MTLRPKFILAVCFQFVLLTNCGPVVAKIMGVNRQSPCKRQQPVSERACRQSRRLVRMGTRSVRKSEKRKQTFDH